MHIIKNDKHFKVYSDTIFRKEKKEDPFSRIRALTDRQGQQKFVCTKYCDKKFLRRKEKHLLNFQSIKPFLNSR